ncbi:hypothetical protein, partial [Enterobacter mori]
NKLGINNDDTDAVGLVYQFYSVHHVVLCLMNRASALFFYARQKIISTIEKPHAFRRNRLASVSNTHMTLPTKVA